MRLLVTCLLSLALVTLASEDPALDNTVQNLLANLFPCSQTLSGVTFDISTMTSTTDFSAPDAKTPGSWSYYFNPCGVANSNPAGSKCATASSTFCQISGTTGNNLGTNTIPATGPQPATPVWSLINPQNPAAGVSVKYANGDACSSGTGFKTGVANFYCSPTAGRGSVNGSVLENPTCTYTMNIITQHVCPGGGGGGGGEGLSGGWIFIIILIVVLFCYIVVGCIYQRKKKGATGSESCPNIEFWRGLPSLVKEGFSFTWTKLRGLCGKGEYTEVK